MENCDDDEEDWTVPCDDGPVSGIAGKDSTEIQVTKMSKTNMSFATIGEQDHRRVVVHIDIDCFYAQVEMLRNPDLKDKPIGVQQKTIVITCNYVARNMGIPKHLYVWEAKEKFPQLILVNGEDLTHYREYSYKISELFLKFTPFVERLGFDENFLDITSLVDQYQSKENYVVGHIYGQKVSAACHCGCHERITAGSHIASDIRKALFEELGITSCAGISHNKLLSKLVAGKHKPNQQTVLFPENVPEFMLTIEKARGIPGIGHSLSKRLEMMNILSVKDLQQADLKYLEEEFGTSQAALMKELSIGIDNALVVPFGRPMTISDEDSFFSKKCCSVPAAQKKIQFLLKGLCKRMQEDGRLPQTIRLSIKKAPGENQYSKRESRQCPIPTNVAHKVLKGANGEYPEALENLVVTLLHKLVNTTQPFQLTLMNIAFANLAEKAKNALDSFLKPVQYETTVCSSQGSETLGKIKNRSGNKSSGLDKWLANAKSKSLPAESDHVNSSCQANNVFKRKYQDNVSGSEVSFWGSSKRMKSESSTYDYQENKEREAKYTDNSTETPAATFLSKSESPHSCFDSTTACDVSKGDNDILLYDDESDHSVYTCRNIASGSEGGNKHLEEPTTSQHFYKSTHEEFVIPNHIDKEVFTNLPPDIQKEYLEEWKRKELSAFKPFNNVLTSQKELSDKQKVQKKGQSQNIASYFNPKN